MEIKKFSDFINEKLVIVNKKSSGKEIKTYQVDTILDEYI